MNQIQMSDGHVASFKDSFLPVKPGMVLRTLTKDGTVEPFSDVLVWDQRAPGEFTLKRPHATGFELIDVNESRIQLHYVVVLTSKGEPYDMSYAAR